MSRVLLLPYFLVVVAGIVWTLALLVREAPLLERQARRQVARWRHRRRRPLLPTLGSDVVVIPRPRTPAGDTIVRADRAASAGAHVPT